MRVGPLRSIAMVAKRSDGALNLIFDADDSLWDSNIHFLEAEAAFVETLGRTEVLDERAIRAAMRRHELRIIESHGYGRRPYLIALIAWPKSLPIHAIMGICARRSHGLVSA